MARTTATISFLALEVKGALLPASLLEEVSKLERPRELLLEASDYGLARGERLRDRIDAAWVLTKELWEEYSNLKERAGPSTAGLHFGLRLLREVLGWSGIEPCNGWRQGEASYAITHRAFAGSVPLIVRGIRAGELDTGSAQFGQEGRKRSPHSCLQECLNADDSANWGLLLSGDRLRLLHDNPSLVKPAYLEADLELLIEGERFDEFSVLWLLLHASRFRHPQSGSCVLDDWKQKAEASGERVLGALRGGVQSALESLGWGFLNHPANGSLRDALQSGQLSRQQFHEQLLRLVYRFLFLFTAEDRKLLFPREIDLSDPRRRIYHEGYSVHRLRELAIKRSGYEGEYGDLWELQRLVFQQLSIGNSPLGLPGLGGLFDAKQCPDLDGAELWNGLLLRAIKAIGWFDAVGNFTRVRYRDLNTEELGSVYEGLLELHPQVEQKGGHLQLSYAGGAGRDRKTTGSYYTPDVLVQELIKSALVPVIDDRLSTASSHAEKEHALLNIKVIDPACGSGHFLLAAARRLAVALAQVRAGNDQPSEDDRQHALRDVVGRCIYAVDKNPMAVELCKVALWIEAIDPGKPLSFLDAHIQCGDSLVGVLDPKVLEEGIPDEAYKPLTGDARTVCTSLRRDNATARRNISRRGSNRGIQGSLDLTGSQPCSQGQQRLKAIEAMPDATLAESAAKQAAYTQWLANRGQDLETLAADLFTATFFLAKTHESLTTVPTTEHLLKLLAGQPIDEAIEEAVVQAAESFGFFHWHLRFGEVMERGGFDCVLGNPPYLFGEDRPQIPDLFALKIRQWDLCWIFAERAEALLMQQGRVGLVLPDSILLRSDPAVVRKFIVERFADILALRAGAVFDANVGAFCLSAKKEHQSVSHVQIGEAGNAKRSDIQIKPANPEAPWLLDIRDRVKPIGQATFASSSMEALSIADVSVISRGEELGKSYLNRLSKHDLIIDPSRIAIMAGEGIKEPYIQPEQTHWTLVNNVRKKPQNYSSPKIVCLKTGRTVRAALDYRELVTLQSVYNIHLTTAGRERGITIEFLCALLNSPRANSIYIESITGAKALFPQITQKMLKEISFSPPSEQVIERVSGIVNSIIAEGISLSREEELYALVDACL